MADNALQSVQKLLQVLVAPDVRETKVKLGELEKRMDGQFASMRKETDAQFASIHNEFASLRRENDANQRTLLAAISEVKAHAESVSARGVMELRERVAVLEAQQRPH